MAKHVDSPKYIVYSSPAFPPEGIKVNEKLLYCEDENGGYIYVNGTKRYEKDEFFKLLFREIK